MYIYICVHICVYICVTFALKIYLCSQTEWCPFQPGRCAPRRFKQPSALDVVLEWILRLFLLRFSGSILGSPGAQHKYNKNITQIAQIYHKDRADKSEEVGNCVYLYVCYICIHVCVIFVFIFVL